MKFEDLVFKKHVCGYGMRATVKFKNNYGASVITGSMFYCTPEKPYELAVTYKDSLCYSSGLTDDVLGYLTKQEVTEYLEKIEAL